MPWRSPAGAWAETKVGVGCDIRVDRSLTVAALLR